MKRILCSRTWLRYCCVEKNQLERTVSTHNRDITLTRINADMLTDG